MKVEVFILKDLQKQEAKHTTKGHVGGEPGLVSTKKEEGENVANNLCWDASRKEWVRQCKQLRKFRNDQLTYFFRLQGIGDAPSCLILGPVVMRMVNNSLGYDCSIKAEVESVGFGLVGLQMKGPLAGESFTILRKWLGSPARISLSKISQAHK